MEINTQMLLNIFGVEVLFTTSSVVNALHGIVPSVFKLTKIRNKISTDYFIQFLGGCAIVSKRHKPAARNAGIPKPRP